MPSPEVTTNYIDSNGVDLGKILITKDYLISVYPQLVDNLVTPELWGWGNNSSSQLGINNATTRSTPVTTFGGTTNWTQVACGGEYTAAIKNNGQLWAWGKNNYAQLGVNDATIRSTPVTTFSGGTNWKQVSCGYQNTAAIKTDGTLWVWGRGASVSGPLHGTNDATNKSTPVTTFAGGTNWKQVSCGYQHTAAIKTDGTLWVWGLNDNGQLGINSSISNHRSTPVTTFAGGTNWKQVSCGGSGTAAIKTDGTLWVWGENNNIKLGINNSGNRSNPVTTFAGGTNWKQVAVGSFHMAAIKTDGTLWVWGNNGSVQLGTNDVITRSTPVTTFAGGTNWKQVVAGINHTMALKTDGTLWVWGTNNAAQLGINTNTNRSTPVTTFTGGTNWKQVSTFNSTDKTASSFSFAIKTGDDLGGI